ncbi:hypothetical protein KJA16_00550 [Patescibacteria group bacterium]|nr:hypothetical protein [Patescibacteria group bacterium]
MEGIAQKKEELLSSLKHKVDHLKEMKAENLIDHVAHEVLYLGFMEWLRILFSAFPGFEWQGKKEAMGLAFVPYKRFLFDRFFIGITERVLDGFGEKDRERLREGGWQKYLNAYRGLD